MVWFIFLGMLAAFGLLCCIYCVAGFFLSNDRQPMLICLLPRGQLPDGAIISYRLLKDLNLVGGPLLIIGTAPPKSPPDIEYCSLQELPARLELERNKLD